MDPSAMLPLSRLIYDITNLPSSLSYLTLSFSFALYSLIFPYPIETPSFGLINC